MWKMMGKVTFLNINRHAGSSLWQIAPKIRYILGKIICPLWEMDCFAHAVEEVNSSK
jgi:hypothetical protein